MFKKYISIFVIIALLLSGCNATEAAKDSENSSLTAEDNIPETETDATDTAVNVTAADTAAESTSENASESSVVTTAQPISKEEIIAKKLYYFKDNTYTAEFPAASIDMSQYEGKFYQWGSYMSIVSETESDFPAEIIQSANAALDEYFREMLRGVEEDEVSGASGHSRTYRIYLEYPALSWSWQIVGEDYDRCFEGDCGFEFKEAACTDFDGDGKEEYFILFRKTNAYDASPLYFTVFVNHEGEAQVLNDAGLGAGLYPVKYNGFTHMLIHSGYNNSTIHTAFFAVENGKAVYKHSEYYLPAPYKGVFMRCGMVQRYGEWLIFWNEELNEYCGVAGDPIDDDEAEALFEAYAMDSDDFSYKIYRYYGKYKTPQLLQQNARRIDNIYYVESDRNEYTFYEYKDGEISSAESITNLSPAVDRYCEIFAVGIDFDKAEENAVPLE